MGYGAIAPIAAIVLALHHVVFTDASIRSKLIVAMVVATSFAVGKFLPEWAIAATLMQIAASVYMLVYLKLRESTAGL